MQYIMYIIHTAHNIYYQKFIQTTILKPVYMY